MSATRGYLSITLAAALWGVAGAAAKYLFASKAVPPLLLVQIRMGLSFLLLAMTLAMVAPHLLRIRRENLRYFAVWGVLGMAAVQFTYLFTISETNVATAIFLQYLAPILTALFAFFFEGQKLGARLLACLGLAMGGSFLLIFGGTARLLVSPMGLVTGLASAGFMSFYTIYGARGVGKLSPWTLLCWGLGAGSLFWLLLDLVLLGLGRPLPGIALLAEGSMWAYFAYIAVLATIVPFGLYLMGLRSVSPTQATITGMLEPVLGGVIAYFALGEALRPVQVTGGGLIVIAVILLQMRRESRS
ncbi:MAG: putative permease, superfamily [Symbiobacteriaceae bacterium]|nr:putative permease, superfamily [Symbiobacteriaceae bacterium]